MSLILAGREAEMRYERNRSCPIQRKAIDGTKKSIHGHQLNVSFRL